MEPGGLEGVPGFEGEELEPGLEGEDGFEGVLPEQDLS